MRFLANLQQWRSRDEEAIDRRLDRRGDQGVRGSGLNLGIKSSLVKTNFLLKSLVEVGWVKVNNFRRSDNKLGYA